MALTIWVFIILCYSASFVSAGDDTELTNKQASNNSLEKSPDLTQVPPTQQPDNNLTMLAFGVISFILILIVVMLILVTVVNVRGHCCKKEEEDVKVYDSVRSESHITSTGEKESITLVSMRTLNTDTDTDSPQISSIHSTVLDGEDQDFNRDLHHIIVGQQTD
ncbi:endothelial cell-specific chemotaxis regulator [Trichomycterus rosablanca]|uniref:endothelial cell-specific chemotaxis regulator n=1 Tax=Trichomycterus rosablanca TaxID=2290929 RepID=UPI002F351464